MGLVIKKTEEQMAADKVRAFVAESIQNRKIEHLPLGEIKANPRNAKNHPKAQIQAIKRSIEAIGYTVPIMVDENGVVLAGHARLEAIRQLKISTVPVIRITGLAEEQKIALALGDNKLAELAEWDFQICAEELGKLYNPEANLSFDPSITGHSMVEVDRLLGFSRADDEEILERPLVDADSICRPGEVWTCGRHKIACGSALDYQVYKKLMGDDLAQLVFTDPPFNVPVAGHVSRRANAREFVEASGEKTSEQFDEFLETTSTMIMRSTQEGAMIYICMDWRHINALSRAAEQFFGPPRNLIVWVKDNFGMGNQYRSQHELISLFVHGKTARWSNVKPGGRSRSNVWSYPGCAGFARGRDELLAMHPTPKPVSLVMDVLLDSSHRNGIVLDPFGGSGTTLIAAERTGRCARLIELDPVYCDTIVRRWQRESGKAATLDGDGTSFDRVANARQE